MFHFRQKFWMYFKVLILIAEGIKPKKNISIKIFTNFKKMCLKLIPRKECILYFGENTILRLRIGQLKNYVFWTSENSMHSEQWFWTAATDTN